MDIIKAAKIIYQIRLSGGQIFLKDNRLGLKGDASKNFLEEVKQSSDTIKHLLSLNESNKSEVLKLFTCLSESGYQLSDLQRSIFAHVIKLQDSSTYNVPLWFTFKGKRQLHQLQHFIKYIVASFPILRSCINDAMELSFFPIKSFNIDYSEIQFNDIEIWKQKCETEKLDLLNNQLISFKAGYCEKLDETYVSFMHHHIIEDVLSLSIIKQKVKEYTSEEDISKVEDQSNNNVHYYDYVLYEQVRKSYCEPSEYYSRIRQALAFEEDSIKIELDNNANVVSGKSVVFEFDDKLIKGIKEFSKDFNITEFNLLISTYALTLSKIYAKNRIFISTTLSTRVPQLMESVGPFINVLPLSFESNIREMSVADFLSLSQRNLNDILVLSSISFDDVLAHVDEDKRTILQDFAFTMHNLPNSIDDELPITNKFKTLKVKYPLSITVTQMSKKLFAYIEFSERFYTESMIQDFFENFNYILQKVVSKEYSSLKDILLSVNQSQKKSIKLLNPSLLNKPISKTIVDMFEEQVINSSEKIAIVYQEESLTYYDLNYKSNQLARAILDKLCENKTYNYKGNSKPIIGICLDRGIDMVISMLATLKIGAAYVPMDPSFPQDRINHILKDAQIDLVVIDNTVNSSFFLEKKDYLNIDSHHYSYQDSRNLNIKISGNQLAYIIYTSGTTGLPKGVMIEHASLVNFLFGIENILGNKGTLLSVTNITFDISILEIFGALVNGFKLIIAPLIGRNGRKNNKLINENKGIDFSLFYFGNHNADSDNQDINKYRLLLEGAKYADDNSFSAIWTPERHFGTFGGLYPNPAITSAAVASITSNIKIRTGSCVLPLHNPIRVAEDWAIIDNISQGRVELSFATGWNKNDFVLAPENFNNRKEMLEDKIEIVKKLWRGESVEFPGVDGESLSISTLPRPIQKDLPVWLTVAFNPESFRRAGEQGAHILTHLLGQSLEQLSERIELYYQGLEYSGYDKKDFKIALMLHTFISDDEEYSLSKVKEPFKQYLSSSINLLKQIKNEDSDNISEEEKNELLEIAFQRYYYENGLFGTPESKIEFIDKLKGIGVTEVACLIDFGIDEDIVIDNLKHLNTLRKLAFTNKNTDITPLELIKKHNVTHLQCTPSLAQLIFNSQKENNIKSLEKILVGGEPMSMHLMQQINRTTSARILNMYGPTEATIWATYANLEKVKKITIGKALPNVSLLILDRNLQPCIQGIAGELFISGPCLARGYIGNTQLTSEKFIPNPFADKKDIENGFSKMYKTGDMVRLLENGEIEYLGRNDFQVKVNGHRIELSEIEYQLLQITNIDQVVVTVKKHSSELGTTSYIVAYYMAKEYIPCDEIASYLSNILPEYMIPSKYMHVETIPLTTNGKVNYKALPEIDTSYNTSYVEPRNELEKDLCQIWCQLLKLNSISINNDFFRSGGNSILAIQASHKMSEILGKRVSLNDIFLFRTIQNIIDNIIGNNEINIPILNLKTAPLSFSQERLWFIQQYEDQKFVYNHPFLLKLNEKTNVIKFKKAIESVFNYHQIFQTIIKQSDNGKYYQEIQNIDVPIVELDNVNNSELDELICDIVNYNFNLEQEPPFKVWVINQKPSNDTLIILNIHHIAIDGWSIKIIFDDLVKFYYNERKGSAIENSKLQFTDFATWQNQYWNKKRLKNQKNFWVDELKGYQQTNLLLDYTRPKNFDYKGKDFTFTINRSLSNKLRDLAKNQAVTFYTLMLSAFNVLLYKQTDQQDIVLGSPIANRHYHGVEDIVGFFVNTLAIRNILDPDVSFKTFLVSVYNKLLEIQKHQDYPFEKLVNDLNTPQNFNQHPIFQIAFGLQNAGELKKPNNLFEQQDIYKYFKVAKFDLSIFIDDSQEDIAFNVNYATSLFKYQSIEILLQRFESLLENIVLNIDKPISELNCYIDQDTLCIKDNQNLVSISTDVISTFNDQVKIQNQKIALIYGNQQISYILLKKQAEDLANLIHDTYFKIYNRSIQKDTVIAIFLKPSAELIIAKLAILMTGSAYVTLSINDPKDRVEYILNDSKACLIVSSNEIIQTNKNITSFNILNIDDQNIDNKINYQYQNNLGADSLAYIIYTSGTTGSPKGVMVEHKNIIALANNQTEINIQSDHVIGQFADVTFDAAIFEIWCSLLNGATLIIPENKQELLSDAVLLEKYIEKNKINVLWLTKMIFDNLFVQNNSVFKRLEYLIIGGEALNKLLIEKIISINDRPMKVINGYGPTESTTFTTFYNCDNQLCSTVPIGKPIDNRQVYVLDKNLKPVGINIIGELYIGGLGLARGYINNTSLTMKTFHKNITLSIKDKHIVCNRLYQTGDLVRWNLDGNLEYIGRRDNQIKIRGYRVEIQDIEKNILKIPGVLQVVVLLINRKNQETSDQNILVAYYVSDIEYTNLEISEKLSLHIPEYMIPKFFIFLESLPTTKNGKLDKSRLEKISLYDVNNNSSIIAPSTQLEHKMYNVWKEILGIKHFSIKDDFFRVGGDSILSIQVSSKLRKLGYNCSVRDIFKYRTIKSLASFLEQNSFHQEYLTEQGILSGEFDLLPIQEWFFDQNFDYSEHWNQAFMIKTDLLDIQRLELAIEKLSSHHDVLRILFLKDKQRQIYQAQGKNHKLMSLNVEGLSPSEISEILTKWQSCFNIYEGPLWSMGYLYGYEDNSARIFFAFHHLIIDSVSWRIIIDDLRDFYLENNPPKKTTSYRQWVDICKEYAKQVIPFEEYYWLMQLNNVNESYNLLSFDKTIKTIEFEFSEKETSCLLYQANKAYNTEIVDLLLSTIAYMLRDLTNHDINGVTLEGHGREIIDERVDLSRTVGWFTSMFPFLLNIGNSIGDTITIIKDRFRLVPNKGVSFGIIKSYSKQIKFIDELPKVSFNYLGQFDNHQNGWSFVDESVGQTIIDNQSKSFLNLDCMIISRKLKCRVTSKLENNSIKELFIKHLSKISEYCMSIVDNQNNILTCSDYYYDIDYEPVIFLNGSKVHKPTLVMIHPGSSGAEAYINTICPYLMEKYNIVILNNYQKYSKNTLSPDSIQELAKLYIYFLNKYKVNLSNYSIYGLSFGATVAYEMYNLMKYFDNQCPKNIFLVDPIFFNWLDFKSNEQYEKLKKVYPGHALYKPSNLDSEAFKNSLKLIKCNKYSTYNIEDKYYTSLVNLICDTDNCGLKIDLRTENVLYVECDHDQTLEQPYVKEIADYLISF
ncbi:non-ribosomal peptide synthetase [Francisella philomiragia]|uniref:non-ribosomal peptide synthetase n=1 Tax=Francisella philomiragia TaxID=28110 RepID=UPI001C9DADEE|nr:non-ribosomal peptide synthetase [Francisella philomiragia]MBY7733425.1 amino acid adenylation domain-containing protein [Francisella philomiragia]